MSKVLGYAAMALGVAALALTGVGLFATPAFMMGLTAAMGGITASMLTVAAGVLSIGASLLAPRPKAPTMSGATLDRLNLSLDPHAMRKAVFGKTAFATDICNNEASDVSGSVDDQQVDRWVVVAAHKVNAIKEIWFENEKVWDSVNGVIARYATDDGGPYLEVQVKLEGTSANYVNAGTRVTPSSLRYTGCAYVYFHFFLNSTSPFSQGIPTRCTIIGEGMPVYDPRKDSTVTGGSGTQRADNQATWSYSVSGNLAGENPALQLFTWLLGWKINGKLSVGKGMPKDRIDWPAVITAANICDETQTLALGGTSKRYTSGGIVSEGDDVLGAVDRWKAAMNATLDDVDGTIRVQSLTNDLGFPIADFTEDDIIDEASWSPSVSLTADFNIVRGTYVNPDTKVLYQMDEYPDVSVTSRDGIDRIESINYDMVQLQSQAERLSKQRLQRGQYAGVFQAMYKITAWKVQKGDVVRQTFGPFGMNQKLFRVIDLEHRWDGYVPLTLREEDAQIYAWDNEDSPVVVHAPPDNYSNANTPWQQMMTGVYNIPGAGGSDANMLKDMTFGIHWLKTAIYFKRVNGQRVSAAFPFPAELRYVGEVALGRGTAVTATSRESLTIVGGRVYYFRVQIARSVGATGTANINFSCIFKNAAGTTVTPGLSGVKAVNTITADGQYYETLFSIAAPATAAKLESYAISVAGNTGVGTVRFCKPWISDKEPGSDVTLTISGTASDTFDYDYTGVAEAGEFPRNFVFKLIAGGVEVTSGVSWSYKVASGTFNGFTTASGSQAMSGTGYGTLTANSLGTSSANADIYALYNGKAIGPFRSSFSKIVAPAPNSSGGGSGGGASSQSSGFTAYSNTTFVTVTNVLNYTMPAGVTTAILSANLNGRPIAASAGSWVSQLKWQRETSIGSGVWNDVGTVVSDGSTVEDISIPGEPVFEVSDEAALVKNVSDTGRTAGVEYAYRCVARVSSGGTKSHNVTGTVSVTS